jgi:glycosyltransferase involved in cell wall biosynthesis
VKSVTRPTIEPTSKGHAVRHSVVIPVFNEEENIPELYQRLTAVMQGLRSPYEIILVDDGSKDRSFPMMKALHEQDPRVKALKLSRNFGHHLALTAGIDYAKGEAVILMDADLQDQPEEIPKLVEKFNEGYDVAYGIRKNRKESLTRRIAASLFMAIMNRVAGSGHFATGGVFRVMSHQVRDELQQCRETSRFITGLVGWLGFDQVGVEVEHGARYAGQTKYSLWRLIKLSLNTITSFSYLPLQLASYLGLLTAVIAVSWGAYIIYRWIFFGVPVAGFTSMIVAILFLGSVQLIVLGLIGEYVGRIFTESQGRPLYVVREVLE